MVAVAQLVESRIVIPVVAGSSPVGHPILFFNLNAKIKLLQLYPIHGAWHLLNPVNHTVPPTTGFNH